MIAKVIPIVDQRAAGARHVRRNDRHTVGGALVNDGYYLGGHMVSLLSGLTNLHLARRSYGDRFR